MTRDELQTAIQEIGTCEDDVQRRELLATLQDNVSTDFEELENLRTTNATLTENNERLRDANMKLFLRVGDSSDSDELTESGSENKKEKLKFEDLFNEKGGLK